MLAWLQGYDHKGCQFLISGFSEGFEIGYKGSVTPSVASNLKSATENPSDQETLNREILQGRIAGPFITPPFKVFKISPLGLVAK